MAQPVPGQKMADCLKLEIALALIFWLPYVLRVDGRYPFEWPYVGIVWFALWMSCPLLAAVAFLMLPRDWQLRWGWAQILMAAALAASIWWKFSTVELF